MIKSFCQADIIPRTGHYKFHASEYRNSVVELLGKAASTYAQRRLQLQNKEGHFIPKSVCSLHKAAVCSNENLRRLAVDPSDHFFAPSSTECNDGRDTGSQSEELFHSLNIPSINPHGVLGKILFDVCVPKNIEEWDIKPSTPFKGTQAFSHTRRRHGFFSPRKCLRRSRL